MKVDTYFEKTGKIYGVSSKCSFGNWSHVGYVFSSMEDAKRWLHTEEYDFRERELMSKSAAEKLCGKNNFEVWQDDGWYYELLRKRHEDFMEVAK